MGVPATSSDGHCVICISSISPGESILILECAHQFHEVCLRPWLNKNDTCPNCRAVTRMFSPGTPRPRGLTTGQATIVASRLGMGILREGFMRTYR